MCWAPRRTAMLREPMTCGGCGRHTGCWTPMMTSSAPAVVPWPKDRTGRWPISSANPGGFGTVCTVTLPRAIIARIYRHRIGALQIAPAIGKARGLHLQALLDHGQPTRRHGLGFTRQMHEYDALRHASKSRSDFADRPRGCLARVSLSNTSEAGSRNSARRDISPTRSNTASPQATSTTSRPRCA